MAIAVETKLERDPSGRQEEPATRAGKLARLWTTHTDACLVSGLVLAIVVVQGVNIANFPTLSDDEGTYLAQAWAIQHGHGLTHYSYWYDHPPLGWIQIAALSWIPALFDHGSETVMYARVVMLPFTAVSAALVYLVARRIALPRWSAALATVVFGLSPLSVTQQREIYLDNIAVMWMLAAFALALSPRRHLWHHIAAGLCAAVAVLSKETMLLVAPALVMAVWRGSARSTRKFSMAGFCTGFLLVTAQYVLFALLKGELLPGPDHNSLIGAVEFQLSRGGSGWILDAGSVNYMTLHWWLVRDPIIICVGVAASLAALFVRRLRAIAVAAVILVLVALRPGGYLPAMYVLQALPFFALAIAGVADTAVRWTLKDRTGPGRPRHSVIFRIPLSGRNAVAFVSVILIGLVAPRWEAGDETALTSRANEQYIAASAWIRTHVPDPAHTRIVVDDALWPDLANHGFQPGLGVIWFYKVDLDPAVKKTLPNGWRDIDYVVSSSIIRQDPSGLPTVRAAMQHSHAVATFGQGDQAIKILRVDHSRSGK